MTENDRDGLTFRPFPSPRTSNEVRGDDERTKGVRVMRRKITAVNPNDREWTKGRFVLWFGAYADTLVLVWANHLEGALDEAVDYLANHAPGLLATKEVQEEGARLRTEHPDWTDEKVWEEAHVDCTPAGGHGDYLRSWEWGIALDNPTREELIAFAKNA